MEFFTGDALFQTHDNLEHLAMMENVVDRKIDAHLIQQVNKMAGRNSNGANKYFKRLKLDYPTPETTRASRRFVKAMKKLHVRYIHHALHVSPLTFQAGYHTIEQHIQPQFPRSPEENLRIRPKQSHHREGSTATPMVQGACWTR